MAAWVVQNSEGTVWKVGEGCGKSVLPWIFSLSVFLVYLTTQKAAVRALVMEACLT